MPQREPVLVGNGQGFWGDSILGPVRLVREGPLHYLTLDYLAEITMSIMQKQRAANPDTGYATDFVRMVERVLPECAEKGIKIIANAGGVNSPACAEAVAQVVRKLGLSGIRIGVVELDDLLTVGETVGHLETGEPLSDHLETVQSANVYLGARPIADALAAGADIVITGRCTDPSLVVAPLVYEFGWSMTDYDKLAAGTVAGHILECGTQSTGGNFDGWRDIPDLAHIGYPIAEAYADGTVVITKHDGTGGRVSKDTVTAQLLYELGDPERYLTPDVVARFDTIELSDDGPDRVKVTGVKGSVATPTYKVSMSMTDGYKLVGDLTVAGPDAVDKAKATAELLWARLEMDGVSFKPEQRMVELIGTNVCFDGMVPARDDAMEVLMRVGVREDDRRKADRVGMELASLITSGPPGLTGFAGGRPRASEVMAYWPTLIDKSRVEATVTVEEVV